MRILVTGATGFIGRHLIPQLLQRPQTAVSLLARSPLKLPPSLATIRDQFEVVYADLRNFNLTVRALREAAPTHIIHLAAAGVTDPFLGVETAVRHNLNGTINLLRASFEKTDTTQQLIVARTPGEETHMNVYATSKAAAWNFCQMYGRNHNWPIHGAMIFQAYGAGQSPRTLIPAAIAAAQQGEDFPMTAGTQKRDWIYAPDVAQGFTALLGQQLPPATTIHLGTGHTTSVADVVQQIYDIVGGNGRPLIGALPSRPGEVPAQIANATHTHTLINWQAATPLNQGIQHLINNASYK